jgi:hypothetical protein
VEKEGEVMERFPLRRIAVLLIILVPIFALGVMNPISAEEIKLSDTRYWFTTKMEVIKLDDTEGHIIQITESKGVDVGRRDLAVSRNIWDLVKGTGTMRGYTTMMDSDGRVTRFFKQEGKAAYTVSSEGKHAMTGEGWWTLIKGVGKWEGVTGGGTWKLKMISEGIFVMDWEGEMVRP